MKDIKEFVAIEGGKYDLSIGTYDIAPFEIGKYPVVNLLFGKFVDDNGYKKPGLWSINGRKLLNCNDVNCPRYWQDDKYNSPYYPVVGVCWYEAEAFCQWLTQTQGDGYTYRLPTEMEWEAAAAGFEKRVYPWGNDWDKSRCNTKEAGIGKISEVGIFESGNTPEGVCDMAGNVWEWTNSEEEKWWVLRGGSWFDDVNFARCYSRDRFYPYIRFYIAGFRCVRTKI